MAKTTRRTTEQQVAALEAKIAALKARAARKEARKNPALRHTTAAVKAIDKALGESDDAAIRRALQEARATLTACLALDGVVVGTEGGGRGRGRRSSANVEQVSAELLAYVTRNPGQRGEQIARALQTDTTTMRLPMKRLIEERKVKTKGQRRGTTYHAV